MISSNEPITIVIPYVAGLSFLRDCLHSALAIPDGDVNIVLSDNTRNEHDRADLDILLKELGTDAVRHATFPAHVAICESMNRSLSTSSSDLVSLLHADDLACPDYVTTIRGLSRAYPDAALYFCGATIIDEAGVNRHSFVDSIKKWLIPDRSQTIVLQGESGVTALARGNFIMGPTVCFRLSRLHALRFDPELPQTADLDLWVRVLIAGGTIVGTRHAAYKYRRHGAQATASANANLSRFTQESKLYDKIADQALAVGWRTAARTARAKTIIRLHLCYLGVLDIVRFKPVAASQKLRLGMRLRKNAD
jgi:hypothetical protein